MSREREEEKNYENVSITFKNHIDHMLYLAVHFSTLFWENNGKWEIEVTMPPRKFPTKKAFPINYNSVKYIGLF